MKQLICVALVLAVTSSLLAQNIKLSPEIRYRVQVKNPDIQGSSDDYDNGWSYQNIEPSYRLDFFTKLIESAKSGQITVYNEPQCLTQMSPKVVEMMISSYDTITYTLPYPPYEDRDTIIKQEVRITEIGFISFYEEWFYNEKTFVIEKRVFSYAPAMIVYFENGEVKGYKSLFWIKCSAIKD